MALALADILDVTTTPEVFDDTATRTFNLATTGVSEGDMMVLCLVINQAGGDVGDVLTDPTGWNEAHNTLVSAASGQRMYTYWREVPGGGLGATLDITSSATNISHGAICFAVTGADTSALDVVGTANTGDGTTITCPAVTASATGGLIIRFADNDDDDQASQPSMSGHTSEGFVQVGATVQNGFNAYVWSALQPSTSVGTSTATITTEQWGGQTFVIAEGVSEGITAVTPSEFDFDNTDVDIDGANFEASQAGGAVYLSDASTLAGSANEVEIDGAINTWSDVQINLDFSGLSQGEIDDLHTLGPGARYIIVTNDSADEYSFAVTLHRPQGVEMVLGAATPGSTTSRITGMSGTFAGGRIEETAAQNPSTTTVNAVADGRREDVWSLQATAAAREETYDFRLRYVGLAADTITQTPQLTVSTGDALLADDVESASEVSAPVIGQEHALLANDVESTSEVGSPSVGQEHALLADDVESTSEVSAPVIAEIYVLLANNVESASEVSSPVIGQEHALLADDTESASEVSLPSVGQEHALLVDDVESASEVATPAVGQEHGLLANDVESASELSEPVLQEVVAGTDNLLADDVESASEVTSPVLGQEHQILANDVESASEVSAPLVGQEHALLANDVESASEVSTPVVSESNVLLADDVESASEVGIPVVGQAHVLLAEDVESTSEVTSPAIGQIHQIFSGHIESASELSTPTLVHLGETYGGVYNAVEHFPTGNTVTITLYDPISGDTISLDDNSCAEIPGTGVFVWDTSNLTSQPTSYQQYAWKMTDGTKDEGGVIIIMNANDYWNNYYMTEAYPADGVSACTPVEMLYSIHQMLSEFSRSGAAVSIKKRDGSEAFQLTLDSDTAPTTSTQSS